MSLQAVLKSLDDLPNIKLDRAILLIGRHPDCDVVIDSKRVSRKHCCIAMVKEYLVVRDLGSTNGILINGQKVEECRLSLGDVLAIGNIRYRLEGPHGVADPSASRKQSKTVSDSQIENSDLPIPLVDEEDDLDHLQTLPSSSPRPLEPKPAKEETHSSLPPKESGDLVIPDDIPLAPLDSDPNLSV